MKSLEDTHLKDILPEYLRGDKTIADCADAINPHLKSIAEKVDVPSLYANFDKLPSLVLDHLAIQYDVSTWRDDWNVETKRNVLKTAIADKRKVGTKRAVLEAIKSFGSIASIVEWWETEPKGEPHTFTVYVNLANSTGKVTEQTQEDVIHLLDGAKPLRSHYNLVLSDHAETGINLTAIVRACIFARITDTE